jgi:hypothetical protein
MFTPFMGKLISLLYISLSMAFWKEVKRQLWKEEATPVNVDPWRDGAENPTPRDVEPEWMKTPTPKTKAAPVVDVDPWGSAKKPRGALNPLKLVVTLFVLVDLCGAAFLWSSNYTITAVGLLVFVPNAAFLLLLRSKI